MRPSPPCASRAATSRCSQAARISSWLQVSARAARRAARGLQAGRLQRPSQINDLGGYIPDGFGAGHNATGPSNPGHAQRGVVVDETALFHLRFGGRLHQGEPLLSQQLRGPHGGRVGDRWCRAQTRSWSATTAPSHQTRTRSRSARTRTRRPTAVGCTE